MWGLRIISGPQSGLTYPLKIGRTLIGRSSHCTIKVEGPNISKEHAFIDLESNGKLFISDNKSRNGTIVNGIKIQKTELKIGSKISLTDVLCDIIDLESNLPSLTTKDKNNSNAVAISRNNSPQLNHQQQALKQQINQKYYHQNNQKVIPQIQNTNNNSTIDSHSVIESQSPFEKINQYIENVMLPGVYKLSEVMEFKLVIGLFLLGYAVSLTLLAIVPMVAISTESIQIEAQRRAITIARSMANVNQQALLNDNETALTTSLAELEEGVSNAFIIRANDGSVMAPATKIGSIPNIPFIDKARKEQKEFVQNIDSNQIGVSIPISAYNPDSGGFAIKAYSIVVYEIGSLSVEDGRTLSLFIQVLAIALILGLCIYFLLSKFVEYPIKFLNTQIDLALKNKSQSTEQSKIEFPLFQNLITNVNTILSRVTQEDSNGKQQIFVNKEIEASNIVAMVGYACIALNKELNIISANNAFENLLGTSDANLRNQPISLIPDQALQKSIHELIERSNHDPNQVHYNELEIGGTNNQVGCLCCFDKSNPSYYIISLTPMG